MTSYIELEKALKTMTKKEKKELLSKTKNDLRACNKERRKHKAIIKRLTLSLHKKDKKNERQKRK